MQQVNKVPRTLDVGHVIYRRHHSHPFPPCLSTRTQQQLLQLIAFSLEQGQEPQQQQLQQQQPQEQAQQKPQPPAEAASRHLAAAAAAAEALAPGAAAIFIAEEHSSTMVLPRAAAALFYLLWAAELAVFCNGTLVHDAGIIFAAPTTPERYKLYGEISFAARGPGIRALWMVPGMQAAAELRYNKQHSNQNETFAPGEFPSTYHAMPGDFRWVRHQQEFQQATSTGWY